VVEPLLARLAPAAFDGAGEDAGRCFLVGLARVVLPLLLVSYRGLGRRLVPVADAPAMRALTLVLRDEEEERAAVQSMVDAMLVTPEAARQAEEWTQALVGPAPGLQVLQLGWHDEAEVGARDALLPWAEGDAAW
jgi:hypothetical protein